MKQTKMHYNQSFVDTRHAGFSDIRLWPCYLGFSFVMLLLAPLTGMLLGMLILGVPLFILARVIATRPQSPQTAQYYRRVEEFSQVVADGGPDTNPDLVVYRSIVHDISSDLNAFLHKTSSAFQRSMGPRKSARLWLKT